MGLYVVSNKLLKSILTAQFPFAVNQMAEEETTLIFLKKKSSLIKEIVCNLMINKLNDVCSE